MTEKHQESIDKLGNIYKGMWSLEHITNPEAKEVHEVVQKAIINPSEYILKPQREGGGNNLYDDDLIKVLTTWDKKDIAQFLIMEKIRAPKIKHYMLRAGRAKYLDTITEYGIFSNVLARNRGQGQEPEILDNEVFGLLIRTKDASCNEGGVNSGFAVMDHVKLYDDSKS